MHTDEVLNATDTIVSAIREALVAECNPQVPQQAREAARLFLSRTPQRDDAIDLGQRLFENTDAKEERTLLFALDLMTSGLKTRKRGDIVKSRIEFCRRVTTWMIAGDGQILESFPVRGKCGSFVAELALREWGDCWEEFPSFLGKLFTSSSLRERWLAACIVKEFLETRATRKQDAVVDVPCASLQALAKKQDSLVDAVAKLWLNAVMDNLRAAFTGSGARRELERIALVSLEALGILCRCPDSEVLIRTGVHRMAWDIAVSAPPLFSSCTKIIGAVGEQLLAGVKKKKRAEKLRSASVLDFVFVITEAARRCISFEDSHLSERWDEDCTCALLVAEFVVPFAECGAMDDFLKLGEKMADPDSMSEERRCLVTLWREGVLRLIAHPCLTIAKLGFKCAGPLISLFASSNPTPSDWKAVEQFVVLAFLRSMKVGEFDQQARMESLSKSSKSHQAFNELMNRITDTAFSGLQLPATVRSSWFKLHVHFITLEAESNAMSLSGQQQHSKDHGELRTTIQHCLQAFVPVQMPSGDFEFSALSEFATPLLSLLDSLRSFITAESDAMDAEAAQRSTSEKFNPRLIPEYIVLDGLLNLVESFFVKSAAVISANNDKKRWSTWNEIASAIGNRITSLHFPKNSLHLETRLLEFISAVSAVFSLNPCPFDVASVVNRLISAIEPGTAGPDPMSCLDEGESSSHSHRLNPSTLRRRALSTLISIVQTKGPCLSPFLPSIFSSISKENETRKAADRPLTIAVQMAVVSFSGDFTRQQSYGHEALASAVALLCSQQFELLVRNAALLVETFFDPSVHSSEMVMAHRKELTTILNLVEVTLKYCRIPSNPQELDRGTYFQAPVIDPQAPEVASFIVRHPLAQDIRVILHRLLNFAVTFQGLWQGEQNQGESWKCIGEEEWQTFEGKAETATGCPEGWRSVVEILFPLGKGAEEDRRIERRHAYELRLKLYQVISDMASVTDGFFTTPGLLPLLEEVLVQPISWMPLSQLVFQTKHVWEKLFVDHSLPVLSCYPTLHLLKNILGGGMREFAKRLESEWQKLEVLTEHPDAVGFTEDRKSHLLRFRTNALRELAGRVLSLIDLSLRIPKPIEDVHANHVAAGMHILASHVAAATHNLPPGAPVAELLPKLHGQFDADGMREFEHEPPDVAPSVASYHSRILLLLKGAIFRERDLCLPFMQLCALALTWPPPALVNSALSLIRTYVTTADKLGEKVLLLEIASGIFPEVLKAALRPHPAPDRKCDFAAHAESGRKTVDTLWCILGVLHRRSQDLETALRYFLQLPRGLSTTDINELRLSVASKKRDVGKGLIRKALSDSDNASSFLLRVQGSGGPFSRPAPLADDEALEFVQRWMSDFL